jgi:hypothetical protein
MLQTEITLAEALRALLTNEKYSDVTLKGTDGILVKANRAMLAVRSPVFDRMLYGDFAEASKCVVDVGYSGDVLEEVIAYIYTDSAPILNEGSRQQSFDDKGDKAVRKVLGLMEAASFFCLSELGKKVQEYTCATLKTSPLFCVAWYAACGDQETTSGALAVSDLAFEKIRLDPKLLLQASYVNLLSSSGLEELLKDERVSADEYTLFLVLQAWTNAETEQCCNSRMDSAAQLSKHLCLEHIDPTNLKQAVASSGLVTNDQLVEAYRRQALKEHDVSSYRKTRLPVAWRKSNNVVASCVSGDLLVADVLQCPVLSSGVHKWSILVERGTYMQLGVVASTALPFNFDDWIGNQGGGWVYSNFGFAFHNGNMIQGQLPTFGQGSIVTFILDLTGEGTLGASVDDNPPILIFSNMQNVHAAGFLPAASLNRPARVRFLGFK